MDRPGPQLVPTIGTYISIALPVLVGLLSPEPWMGVAALIWAIIYQQVENLTIEPRISAKAVDVHPAVSFASVMIGSALFGVAGALLSIPVVAVVLALVDIFVRCHELLPELRAKASGQRADGSKLGSDGAVDAGGRPSFVRRSLHRLPRRRRDAAVPGPPADPSGPPGSA